MNIHELDSYNLGDAVKFNNKLNPRIWGADEKMHPQVRDQLLKIAEDFQEFLGIDVEVKDITVSGSNAAYTYTPHSDIDLHLVVDLPQADANEVYRELFDAKKYAYNEQHNIKIGDYDVELYVQDANKDHVSQGIYSVLNNDWVSVPKRRQPDINDISVKSKFEDLGHRIESAIASGSYEKMNELAQKIRDYRQAGLDAHGEFGAENLAFKILRTQGLIKKLYDARNVAKDKLLSLDERRKKKKKKVKYGFGGYWYPGTAYAGQDHPAGSEGGDGGGDGGGGESIREDVGVSDEQTLKDFVDFCVKELKIKNMPKVKLRRDPQWSVRNKTFGRYIDDQKMLEVAWGNRHIMDVLRTVAHELTHKHQHERESMPASAGETGSKYENEANARAGILMRDYGRLHPELFDNGTAELEESASGYIPTKAQAKDPRYSMALTQDIRPGQVGKEANKLKLKTNKQGQPQIAQASGLFEQLMMEYQSVKEKKIFALAEEELDEVNMSPGALEKFAASDEAKGIRAGFEAELIFRDTNSDDDEDQNMEPDYDYDERAYSIQQVIEFFSNDEYGYGLSDRGQSRLMDDLDETYMNWRDERMMEDFKNEADDLVRKVIEDEEWDWDDAVRNQLDDMGLSDDEIEEAMEAGNKAPRFTKLSDQDTYAQENPGYQRYLEAYSAAESILDDLVEESVKEQDKYWDAALDDFRDNYDTDDSDFFSDVGLRWMSDIANNYDLDWPYWTGGGNSNNGSRSWDEIAEDLAQVLGMTVKVSSGYHSMTRREGQWIMEPDGSLSPDDPSEEAGIEIVSPPMPLLTTIEKLKQLTDWANNPRQGNAYTNSSTGLHMGVSLPVRGSDVDYVKLILFMGDQYVLEKFGRSANTYTASALEKFRQNLRGKRSDPAGVIKLLQHGLTELAFKELQKGVGTSKYTSAHLQNGYIEFRSPGGDWLAKADEDIGVLENTMMRFARAMQIAGDPSAERQEYAKKLYKLVTADNEQYADQLRLFAEFSAGTIDKEELKKQWAEKTIGKELTTNQRWQLYQFDEIAGEFTPVPGQSYNGYTEDEVKNKIWSKYGREALDTGEYKLVNMSEDQQWEIYDVKTGQTLEIVKGKNKGEAADAVYDKYAEQGIGFNVRPYVDPATLTARAKLAKRIKEPKVTPAVAADNAQDSQDLRAELTGSGNYEIVDRRTGEVKLQYTASNQEDAGNKYNNWLRNQGMPVDTENYGYRPQQAVNDIPMNVAQNIHEPAPRADFEVYDSSDNDRVVGTLSNATAERVRELIQSYESPSGGYAPGVLRVRQVNESIDDAQRARNAMDSAAKKLGYANFAAVPQSARNTVMQMAVNALKLDNGHYNMLDRKNKLKETLKVTPVVPVRQDATRTKYNQVPRKDDPAPNPATVLKLSPVAKKIQSVKEAAEDRSNHSYTTAYHITGLENAEEIMYSGLDPRDGKAFLIVDEGNPKQLKDEIYQVTGWLEAKAYNPDEELTLLKVDITGIPLKYEFGWNFSTTRIPASRIQDLGPDALRKYV